MSEPADGSIMNFVPISSRRSSLPDDDFAESSTPTPSSWTVGRNPSGTSQPTQPGLKIRRLRPTAHRQMSALNSHCEYPDLPMVGYLISFGECDPDLREPEGSYLVGLDADSGLRG